MTDPENDHLSQIVTRWSMLREAQASRGQDARAAQEQMLHLYGGAIRRYLLACVRRPEVADELYQEFALRFIQGSLHGACPEKGRFRHYLKGVLFHLLADFHQRQKRQPAKLDTQVQDPPAEDASVGAEDHAQFLADWRAELLAQTWVALQKENEVSGQRWFEVLAYRRDHPDKGSEAMASHFATAWGRPVSGAAMRQTLHRARERFAELLFDRVLFSLATPSVESLQEELADLQLLAYCQPALDQWRREHDHGE